jgi:hypothetical protein
MGILVSQARNTLLAGWLLFLHFLQEKKPPGKKRKNCEILSLKQRKWI